jgi:hypothetical protein
VSEKRLQGCQVEFRGEPETSPVVEAAVGAEHMAMRVEALGKVPKRLDSNDRTRESSGFRNGCLEEAPQGIPTTTAELCQQLSVMEEEAAEDFRYAQYEVPVGDRAKHVTAEPLAELPLCDCD